MLQQTQVATVIPYYRRFLRRFPTLRALARAELDDVLRLWAGLGYYARARSLHRTARMILDEYGGRFPTTADELQRLPGIGRYTAGAIASIAFDRRAPVVDGNIARVLARLFRIERDVRDGPGRDLTWALAEKLLPRKRCADFNQALMELGATICTPGESARCQSCPVRRDCIAHRAGIAAGLPIKTRRVVVKSETHVVAAIAHAGRWLFVRRPPDGLWGGLWSLPTAVANGEPTTTLARRLARDQGVARVCVTREPFCDLTHQLTHRTIRLVGHLCRQETPAGRPPDASRWVSVEQFDTLGMSTAMQKVVQALARIPRRMDRRTRSQSEPRP